MTTSRAWMDSKGMPSCSPLNTCSNSSRFTWATCLIPTCWSRKGWGGGEKEDSEGEETKREERGIGGIRGGKKGERGERGGGERYGGKGRERERKREGEGKRGRGRERGREGGGGGKEAREGGRGRKRRGGTGKMKGRCKDKND